MRLPRKTLTDQELIQYATQIKIPDFRAVCMRDELEVIRPPRDRECGILNFQTHLQKGSHWTCWLKNGKERYYFDSYGEPPPHELIVYLKTRKEHNLPVIKRSAVTVQTDGSSECGALCLYVLKKLSQGIQFSDVLEELVKRYESSNPSSGLFIKT